MTTMQGFRCWVAGSVARTVHSDIGTLPSSADAVFLAAHTPVTVRHNRGGGSEVIKADATGEEQIRAVLVGALTDGDQQERNTLIAVTGRSGTGKSHVVRWVNAQLDHDADAYHVLYVPRAVQTIRDLLRHIVGGLPDIGDENLTASIDAAVSNKSPQELRDRLLHEMILALRWKLEPRSAIEGESRAEQMSREERNSLLGVAPTGGVEREDGIADLLAMPLVSRALRQDDGVLARVVNSLLARTSRRDADQLFSESDLPLRTPGVRSELRGNPSLADLWNVIRNDPHPALRLLDEALAQASTEALGLRGGAGNDTLDTLFRRSRRRLRERGRQLVLLFEDLAQFGLIDGELYDQFALAPGEDMAPLRVVFAITHDRYRRLPETVATRINHEFVVEGEAMASTEGFVARYLNLVRVDRPDVEEAWARVKTSGERDQAWVRNACNTREEGLPCRFRDACHEAFGTVDVPGLGAVGRYPYNGPALRRAIEGQSRDTTPPTPREILDECVINTLTEAEAHLQRKTYPDRATWERFANDAPRGRAAVVGEQSGPEADRLYRALVLWGDEHPVHHTIAEAFDLPAVGSATKTGQESGDGPTDRRTIPAPVPSERESPLRSLFDWQNGKELNDNDIDHYRSLLMDMVQAQVDLDLDLFHTTSGHGKDLLNSVFNRTSFDFGQAARGRPPGDRVRFSLDPKESDDVKVLIAARWFRDNKHWVPKEGRWPWPDGYEPVDLKIRLESRLEGWAAEVREAFRRAARGRDVARAAVALRATALLAVGTDAELLHSLGGVLTGAGTTYGVASETWQGVEATARGMLNGPLTRQLVQEFAAVRQGTGAPQLVDAGALERAVEQTLDGPTGRLRELGASAFDAAPALTQQAQQLVEAVEGSCSALLVDVAAAVHDLADGLEQQPARAVALAASDTWRRAMDSSLTRGSWTEFADAVETLKQLAPSVPTNWRPAGERSAPDEALLIQSWARDARNGAGALAILRRGLATVLADTQRRGTLSGDVKELEDRVRDMLRRAEKCLTALEIHGGAV